MSASSPEEPLSNAVVDQQQATASTKKRPAEESAEKSTQKISKRRKKAKSKSASNDDGLLDHENNLNNAFSVMDNQLLADYFSQMTSKFGTDLSSVELADLSLSAATIKDTTSWEGTRTLDKLPSFLESLAKTSQDLRKASKDYGAPHTLIVAGAGLRAADIVRATRTFASKDKIVAKLFAKHMKVEEQEQLLKKSRVVIGVGTPARLSQLIETGALSLAHLERIVVDASHIDQKKRGVMNMKDTMIPLSQFLSRNEFKEKFVDEKKPLSVVFY